MRRLSRPLLASLALLLTAAPALAAPPAPAERFLARDAAMVFLFPSLERALGQASGLLATAATFPGGDELAKKRRELERSVGFDLFDPLWLEDAGIDPRRAAAAALLSTDPELDDAQVLFVLPVADAARFEKAFARVAREELKLPNRSVAPGPQKVTVWQGNKARKPKGEVLAYALVEGNAVLALEARAVDRVKAALAVPRAAHVGTLPVYAELLRSLGPDFGLVAFVPPGSPVVQKEPMLERGYAMAAAGGAEGARVAIALPLPRSSPLLAAASVDSASLVGKIDPGAFLVGRNGTDLRAFMTVDDLFRANKKKPSPEARELAADFLDALGAGMAMGVSMPRPAAGDETPTLEKAPFAYFRGEMVFGLSDPSRMKALVRRMLADLSEGKLEVSENGPWTLPLPGGELGIAVEKRRMLVALGPAGALQALSARTGSTFTAPTDASAKALNGPSGLYVDVPKLVAGLRGLPEGAFGATAKGRRNYHELQAALTVLARFQEIALWSETVGTTLRVEASVRVDPNAEAESEEAGGAWGVE